MTDFTQFKDADMLHEMGTDANKWAASFCQHNPEADLDEHVVMGWFANAIMFAIDTTNGTIINGEHAEYLRERESTVLGHFDTSGKAVTDE